MAWLKKRSRTPAQQLRVRELHFIGEQDGDPERLLKENLSRVLSMYPEVAAAYLARVHFGNPGETSVCICLHRQDGEDPRIIREFGRIFSSIFASSQHMDIIFLTATQETQIRSVCRAFYGRKCLR